MKSVPATLFFKAMKEPPEGYDCHYDIKHLWKPIEERRPYWVFEYWHGEMFRNRPAKHMCGLFTMLTPYRPGEKCYVREAWYCENENTAQDIMSRGQGIYYKSSEEHPEIFPYWRSPVTMPMWAARRFVTILSCEPVRIEDVTEEDCIGMGVDSSKYGKTYRFAFLFDWHKRHPGKEWAWRVESEEEK